MFKVNLLVVSALLSVLGISLVLSAMFSILGAMLHIRILQMLVVIAISSSGLALVVYILINIDAKK